MFCISDDIPGQWYIWLVRFLIQERPLWVLCREVNIALRTPAGTMIFDESSMRRPLSVTLSLSYIFLCGAVTFLTVGWFVFWMYARRRS